MPFGVYVSFVIASGPVTVRKLYEKIVLKSGYIIVLWNLYKSVVVMERKRNKSLNLKWTLKWNSCLAKLKKMWSITSDGVIILKNFAIVKCMCRTGTNINYILLPSLAIGPLANEDVIK